MTRPPTRRTPPASDADHALPPDDLGQAGEASFKALCARAGLVCNASDRDRTGWDFHVERRPEADGVLDQRQRTTCFVQLKSTAVAGTHSVSLSLSSAEMLAKVPGPSLVVALRMRSDGHPLRGWVVPMLGPPLAKLLRRLRQAEASGRRDLNNLRITFDFQRHGDPFELTPDGLSAALDRACGDDPAAYAAEKTRQLAELGYDAGGGLVAEAAFAFEGDEHLGRVLLGLEPIRPIALAAFDVRFGIAIPYTGDMFDAVEEITLSPLRIGSCTVAVTGPALSPAATFEAEVLASPAPGADVRLAVRHPDFTLTFRDRDANFESTGVLGDRVRSLPDTAMLLRALNHFASGEGRIVVTGRDPAFGPLRMPMATRLAGPYLDQLPALGGLVDDWLRLLQMAGVRPTALLSFDDLWDTRKAQIAADLVLAAEPTSHFEFDAERDDTGSFVLPATDGPAEAELLATYFDTATIKGEGVTFSVEVTLRNSSEEPATFKAVAFRPIEVIPAVADLDDYMDDLVARRGPGIMIHPDNLTHVERSRRDVPLVRPGAP